MHIKKKKGGSACQSNPYYMEIFTIFLKNVLFTLGCSGLKVAFISQGFCFQLCKQFAKFSSLKPTEKGRPGGFLFTGGIAEQIRKQFGGESRRKEDREKHIAVGRVFPGAVGFSLVSLPRLIPGGCRREINRWKSFP